MPLRNYGVLAGGVLDTRAEGGSGAPHFQIRVRGGEVEFRVAVNVLSQQSPSELLYAADEAFDHPVLAALPDLPDGFSPLPSGAGRGAFDYIRGNLLDRESMRTLPSTRPGPDNDLADKLHHYVDRAQADRPRGSTPSGSAGGRRTARPTRSSASPPATASTTST